MTPIFCLIVCAALKTTLKKAKPLSIFENGYNFLLTAKVSLALEENRNCPRLLIAIYNFCDISNKMNSFYDDFVRKNLENSKD